jgi:crossover junction endodeoxyribonuclease RuvC
MKGKGIPGSTKKKTHQNNAKGDWASFVADNPDRVKGM